MWPGPGQSFNDVCRSLRFSENCPRHFQPVGLMLIAVNADHMTFPVYSLHEIRVFFSLRSDHKKRGCDSVLF